MTMTAPAPRRRAAGGPGPPADVLSPTSSTWPGRRCCRRGGLSPSLRALPAPSWAVESLAPTADVAAIWIANGIPLVIILSWSRKEPWLHAAAAAAGNLAMHLVNAMGRGSRWVHAVHAGEVVAARHRALRRVEIVGRCGRPPVSDLGAARARSRAPPPGRRWRADAPTRRSCRSGRPGAIAVPPVLIVTPASTVGASRSRFRDGRGPGRPVRGDRGRVC